MYFILERELKKNSITREQLAEKLGISISTISCKLNDKSEFSIKECRKIKEILNFQGSIDELFKTE
ncbi:helix-turn-helix domain-containing protein [Amedibacterium intestinale]|uniref:helix-turn-helix domain-containing protein n=1 Tax=Amedibacterium intestinale TaxID=2583452 RepID=UPI000E200078